MVTSHELHKREKKSRKRDVCNLSPLELYKSTYGAAGFSNETVKNAAVNKTKADNGNTGSRRVLNKTPTMMESSPLEGIRNKTFGKKFSFAPISGQADNQGVNIKLDENMITMPKN